MTKFDEGMMPIDTLLAGIAAGVLGTLVGLTLRIRGIVADNGIEARDFIGGRGVCSASFSVYRFGIDGRVAVLDSDLIPAGGRADRIIGDCHQLVSSTTQGTYMISTKSIFQPPIVRNHFRFLGPDFPRLQFDLIHFILHDPAPLDT